MWAMTPTLLNMQIDPRVVALVAYIARLEGTAGNGAGKASKYAGESLSQQIAMQCLAFEAGCLQTLQMQVRHTGWARAQRCAGDRIVISFILAYKGYLLVILYMLIIVR
jgi:hypothetical protein